jgi:FtsP/CotA-like multicopper oxidase with cupredoxin domain
LPEPKPLPPNPLPERIDLKAALRHELPIEATAGSAPLLEQRPPLFTVKRGRPVVLAVSNRSDSGSSAHLHGHHVRLLDRLDDGWKPFWLDTFMVAAGQTERVAFVAANPGKWLIDCRAIGRIGGTANWFEVT